MGWNVWHCLKIICQLIICEGRGFLSCKAHGAQRNEGKDQRKTREKEALIARDETMEHEAIL